jgi:hypothetical protein
LPFIVDNFIGKKSLKRSPISRVKVKKMSKYMKVGGLRSTQFLVLVLLIQCLMFRVYANENFSPPGIVRTVEVEASQPLIFPIPFSPSPSNITQIFAGQIESTGLLVDQWDPENQIWLTAKYVVNEGWTGDAISVNKAFPLSVQLPVGQPNIKLSFGGVLPLNPLTQTLYPGLNLVGSPKLSTQPLTVWNWDELGVAGSSISTSDVLYSPDNQPQAWLKYESGVGVWTGVTDPLLPGTLSPIFAYFYEYKGVDPVLVSEEGVILDYITIPRVGEVTYDAVQNNVQVTVLSDLNFGNTVDLFYQDITFPAEYDPASPWTVWQLDAPIANNESTTFTDGGDVNRVHPRMVDVRLYQVGTSFDGDDDGLSDAREQLVTQTDAGDPDTDDDGVPDGVEVDLGLDPNVADPSVSTNDLIVDVLDENEQDNTGRLTATFSGGALIPANGISGGAIAGNTIALELRGSSQQLNFGAHPDFNSSGPYRTRTFSMWFAVERFNQSKQVLFESGGISRGFNAYIDGSTLYVGAWDTVLDYGDQTVWPGSWLTTTDIQVNTWHHLVLVLDASVDPTQLNAGTLRAYVDGKEIGDGLNGMQVTGHGGLAALGGVLDSTYMHDGTTSGNFNLVGAVDAFQVWNRALTKTDVALLYYPILSEASNSSWYMSPLAYIPFENGFTDAQENLQTNVSGTPSRLDEVINGKAAHFPGSGSLEIIGHEMYNLAGSFTTRTVSFWFTIDHFDFGKQILYETGGSTRGMNVYVENGLLHAGAWDQTADPEVGDLDSWPGSWQTTSRLQENQWHMVTLVLDASANPTQLSSGVFKAYLDGVLFEEGSTQGMQIAPHWDGGGFGEIVGATRFPEGTETPGLHFHGGLDEVKIWNRALEQNEISGLHQMGAANGVSPQWDVNSFYPITGSLGDDPDGDGYSNALEIEQGTNPDVANYNPATASGLTREVWLNVAGTYVTNLTSLPAYPFSPDLTTSVSNLFTAPVNFGDNYGQRISGIFHAPRTGIYLFHISGDDRCELWVTTATGGRQLVAEVPGHTDPGEWDTYQEQRSAPIELEAGQSYVVEALMKEGSQGDHLEVGISFPTVFSYCDTKRAELPVLTKWFETPPPEVSYELDGDADGLTDYEEWVLGTNPELADTDTDGLNDGWEVDSGFDPLNLLLPVQTDDLDADGLSVIEESVLQTNPHSADTDCDGIEDLLEIQNDTDPLVPDNPGICLEVLTPLF